MPNALTSNPFEWITRLDTTSQIVLMELVEKGLIQLHAAPGFSQHEIDYVLSYLPFIQPIPARLIWLACNPVSCATPEPIPEPELPAPLAPEAFFELQRQGRAELEAVLERFTDSRLRSVAITLLMLESGSLPSAEKAVDMIRQQLGLAESSIPMFMRAGEAAIAFYRTPRQHEASQ